MNDETKPNVEEDVPSEFARIILYQQKQGTYSWDHDAFGTPLILSVPSKFTYRQLYCHIVNHLSCGAPEGKSVPPSPTHLLPAPLHRPTAPAFRLRSDGHSPFPILVGIEKNKKQNVLFKPRLVQHRLVLFPCPRAPF